jgi:photosystem II stability/assembly factor-like uncharacterized protein
MRQAIRLQYKVQLFAFCWVAELFLTENSENFSTSLRPMIRQLSTSLLRAFQLAFLGGLVTFIRSGLADDPVSLRDPFPKEVLEQVEFRLVGPFRGGRSAAIEGVRGKPTRFYMGATGGGVWVTDDGGSTWKNISDGHFGGSIGAVAVAPSDPNILYVGGGEKTLRGNVSHGDGVWKSLDAGKSWTHVGLSDTRHIPRIRIHPRDPNTVYVAAIGHLFGGNAERGVFRTRDGGKTWQNILQINEEVGAFDLLIDPNNSRTLYASTWRVLRTPYSLESGGEGSGIWKTEDEGETWINLSEKKGLPKGPLGIIGVAVSPVDSNRVWAMIEANEGGLFRSDDAGETWTLVSADRNLRQRAWYYTRVYADTRELDTVYVLNVGFHRSRDGGKTFGSISTPHGDHHDLWIDPDDNQRMIIADDGGAQVTFNGGETFSTYLNQPTAQFYRVTTDTHVPWRIYGAQQDNSTVRINHRGDGAFITDRDWEPTAGGESGHIAPDPTDPDIVYGGSYGGYLTRHNHRTGESRQVDIWPDNPMGHGAEDSKFRFQWNFPILFSRHDPETLYAASNVLFRTSNDGQNWEQISPDLTRNDLRRLKPSGGPITKDNTGVEYYCTIFAVTESVTEKGVIWSGSDDGLIHVTKDSGKNWKNVTPPDLPEWAQINSLEADPFHPGGLYVAATRYKSDDFRPYLYVTQDYGETWKRIDEGIPRNEFTRVIRADSKRIGLLFVGTERGLWVSSDDGANWQSLRNNLPIVPITDLAIKDNSLVIATQGRSFWMIDDLTLLRTFDRAAIEKALFIVPPTEVVRMGGGGGKPTLTAGANLRQEGSIQFWLKEVPENKDAKIRIIDSAGRSAIVFVRDEKQELGEAKLELKAGWNRIAWDLRYPAAEKFDNLILWGGGTGGPLAAPGEYTVKFELGEPPIEVPLKVVKDPRSSASDSDLQEQFSFLLEVRDKLSQIHLAIQSIRKLKVQLNDFSDRFQKKPEYKELRNHAQQLSESLTEIEKELYQTQNKSSQDPLNFPIKLNNRLAGLVGVVSHGDNRPTDQSLRVRDELYGLIDAQLNKLSALKKELDQFNEAANRLRVPLIFSEN